MMRSCLFLFLFFLFGGCVLYAQQPSSTEKAKDLCRIEGRTLNSVTGEPLTAVNLALRMSGANPVSRAATTDDAGKFTFEALEPGTYTLMAEKAGFLQQAFGARSSLFSETPLSLAAGQTLKDLEFKLTPQGVITGKVLDDAGEPITRVRVNALPVGGYGGRPRPTGGASSQTNDVGQFRLARLSPGRYVIKVSPRPPSILDPRAPTPHETDKPEQALLPTYYPTGGDASAAIPVTVAAGQEVPGINLTMRKGDVFRVQGRVAITTSGVTASGVTVRLVPRESNTSGVMIVSVSGLPGGTGNLKADGSFELGNVEPGAYYVTATTAGGQLEVLGRVPVDVGNANVKGLIIRAGDRLQLSGTVRVEGNDKADVKGIGIILRVADGMASNPPNATSNADGSFKISGVPPEKYLFVVYGFPEGSYLKSIRRGEQDVLDTGLDLSQEQASAPIEVVLSSKAATVAGIVRDGDSPAPGRDVTLIPDPPLAGRAYLIKTASSDQNGRFNFKGVAPGRYRLYAWEESPPDLLSDLESLKQFDSKSVKVQLGESERTQVDATVIKPGDAQNP